MYIFHSKLCLFVVFPYIHPYIHTCIHAHVVIVWTYSQRYVYICDIYIYIHVCRVLFWCFVKFIFKKQEVLSVSFPKEYDHINLAAKHPKLCTYFIQNSVHIHTSIHTCIHTHLLIVWFCSKTFTLIYSKAEFISVTQAEVLSVWLPKEYDHINLAAKKHPKLCTYFIQDSVHIHTSIHTCIHTHLLIDRFFHRHLFRYTVQRSL